MDIHLLRIEAPEIAASARPGQYVMVLCGEGHGMPLRRPLSVHRICLDSGCIELLFAVVGRGTQWLAERCKGDSIDLFGPLGTGFEIHPSSGNLLLVAGGIGIAPLVALADEAVSDGHPVTLLTGDRTAERICPGHLLPSGIKIIVATEDGSLGQKGMITDLLPEFIPEADQIFACGPLPMYRSMAEKVNEFGDKTVQVLLETVLGCGVGACLGCSIETRAGRKLVCKDGPVFEFSDIVWDSVAIPSCTRRY